MEVSRAEVVDGVLHARLRRDRSLPGAGTVALTRLLPHTRLRLGDSEVPGRRDDALTVLDVPDGPAVDLVAAP
jgi:hypothetical protein